MSRLFPALALGAVLSATTVLGTGAPVVAASGAGPTPVDAASGPGSGHSGPTLLLLSQTPWVGPGQPMALRLGLGRGSRTGLQLTVTLYGCLSSRSAFAETVNGATPGPAVSSTTVPADSLPADPAGGVDLTIPVDDGSTPVAATGPFTALLRCANGPPGVYPMRLKLASTSGGSTTQFFTYLVYASPPASTQKLRFAWVAPVSLPPTTANGNGALPSPSASQVDALDTLVAELAEHAGVPVTIAPEPAVVGALAGSTRPRAKAALSTLGTVTTQSSHETLAQGYVPVDATALVSNGLGAEVAEQVRRAAQALAPFHAAAGTWLADGTLDSATLAQLQTLGFTRFVLPPSAVTQSGPAPALTTARPYVLSAGHGVAPPAVTSDVALSSHLAAGSGPNAALAAYQLLADLALVYYEQPNLDTARGVVAVPPTGWAPDATFLSTVLSALPSDPLVEPVTLDTLFTTVPVATAVHHPATVTGNATVPVRQIRSARGRLDAFASSVADQGMPTVHALDDLLLGAESDQLRGTQQLAGIAGFNGDLDHQLAGISIRTDTIRLTSTAAKVPITVLKQTPYPVSGVLEVTGDKIVFPNGAAQSPGSVCRAPAVQVSAERSTFSCRAQLSLTTNAVYVDMRARATGDFRLSVTLSSPSGHLVLATSHLTVRSLSTSAVAIALSAAAVAVLVLWWGRSLWRGRKPGKPRGAHVRRRAQERNPQPVP
ncbi:MAG: hypothetical protein ACYDA2_06675 [Acidimicrobiales bacterium]